jgi:hypothetical protein
MTFSRAHRNGIGTKRNPNMQVEERTITSIKPYDNNPRFNDEAVDAVATSIREFGFRQPIVIDENDVIIVGHTRYKAALKLGLEMVPVHVAKGLSPAQAKAYRIADNQTATLSQWDQDKLPLELAGLQEMGFDLDLTGFSADELLQLLDSGPGTGLTDPDDIPEPPDEAKTKPGDLLILGNHRLLCGDSGKSEDVDRLLDGAPIHLVNTDPPYNVRVEPRSNNAIAAGLSSFAGYGNSDLEPGFVPLGVDLPEDCGIKGRGWRLAAGGGPIALFTHRLDQLLAVHRLTRFTQDFGSRVDRTHLLGRVVRGRLLGSG